MIYDEEKIREILKNLREQMGKTQAEMSEMLNVSVIHYSQIEQGRRKMSLELLLRIAAVFEVDPNTILGINTESETVDSTIDDLLKRLNKLNPEEKMYVLSVYDAFMDGYYARRGAIAV